MVRSGLQSKTQTYFVISWNSFYPLYPPAESVPLDFSLAPEALNISLIPDILILPSDMKYFVKVNVYTNFNVKASLTDHTEW